MNRHAYADLLSRVRAGHKYTERVRSAIYSVVAIAEAFSARATAIAVDRNLTPDGRKAAARSELETTWLRRLREQALFTADLEAEASAIRSRIAVSIDATDAVGHLARQELRTWLRSLPYEERSKQALSRNEEIELAILSAVPELSGLTDIPEGVFDKVAQAYKSRKFPTEMAEAEALDELRTIAKAAVELAANELMSESGLHERDFTTLRNQIDGGKNAAWLFKAKNVLGEETVRVCVPNKHTGEAEYRDATADDLASGQYFRDRDHWALAQGYVNFDQFLREGESAA